VSPSLTPLIAVLLPLAGAPLVALLDKRPNLREAATLITGIGLLAVVISLVPEVLAGARPQIHLLEILPGLNLSLHVEPLGMLFAVIAASLWIVTSIYAIGYMRGHHEENQTRFFFFFAVAIAAAMGVAFAGNLLTLFVFYEILTLSTYPLVTHHRTPEAMRGGRIYMGILLSTSIAFLLFAIIWTWSLTGTVDFKTDGILAGKTDTTTITILLVLFAFGTGKAALMPLHRWLPAAMVAPTPVSALLHAVAVVKAGVFTIVKVTVYIFGLDLLHDTGASSWLVYLSGTTIIVASLVALTKNNLKARLAYSTISQLSYIILGAALANDLGKIGGSLHIATHAFGKITLFFCAGAILVATHKSEISDMKGIGRQMPLTMFAFLIGSLSIIGLPPFAGAWSKWYLILGAIEAQHYFAVAVLALSSLLNIAYLLPIVANAFFASTADEEHGGIEEAPLACVIPLLFTAACCLALFLYPDPWLDLVRHIGVF
jgi:multicomponent Na+:H+ antiporter subunit D